MLRAFYDRLDVKTYVDRCKTRVSELPALEETDLPCGPYLVAVHQADHIHMIALSDEGSARSLFEQVDKKWAGGLFDRRHEVSPWK